MDTKLIYSLRQYGENILNHLKALISMPESKKKIGPEKFLTVSKPVAIFKKYGIQGIFK